MKYKMNAVGSLGGSTMKYTTLKDRGSYDSCCPEWRVEERFIVCFTSSLRRLGMKLVLHDCTLQDSKERHHNFFHGGSEGSAPRCVHFSLHVKPLLSVTV